MRSITPIAPLIAALLIITTTIAVGAAAVSAISTENLNVKVLYDGVPIGGVTVVASGPSYLSTVTTPGGEAIFGQVPEGTYLITARKVTDGGILIGSMTMTLPDVGNNKRLLIMCNPTPTPTATPTPVPSSTPTPSPSATPTPTPNPTPTPTPTPTPSATPTPSPTPTPTPAPEAPMAGYQIAMPPQSDESYLFVNGVWTWIVHGLIGAEQMFPVEGYLSGWVF